MSDDRRIVDPEDLIAPAGPDDRSQGVNVRNKMDGIVRFSKRGRYLMFAIVAVIAVGFAYGFGIFNPQPKNAVATPAPQPSAAGPAVEPQSNTTLDQLTKKAPTALPPLTTPTPNAQLASQIGAASANHSDGTSLSQAVSAAQPGQSTIAVPAYVPPVSSAVVPNVGQLASQAVGSGFQGPTETPQQKRQRELTQARHASFFVGANNAGQAANDGVPTSVAPGAVPAPSGSPSSEVTSGQLQRVRYQNGDGERPPYLAATQQTPAGTYELWAGSVLGAQLDTGINADLPGPAVAHITRDVFDSKSGMHMLIPKGSRLIGRYNSQVTTGQARVQIVWDRLIWPDGRYINLLAQPGADNQGNAGLFADVNDHRGSLITATLLTGVLAAASNIVQPQTQAVVQSNGQIVYENVGQQIAQTGQEIVKKKLEQAPTLTVPIGEEFNVLLDRTIVLNPWESHP